MCEYALVVDEVITCEPRRERCTLCVMGNAKTEWIDTVTNFWDKYAVILKRMER